MQSTFRTSSSIRTLMFPSHTLSCSSLQPQDTSRAIQVRCAHPIGTCCMTIMATPSAIFGNVAPLCVGCL